MKRFLSLLCMALVLFTSVAQATTDDKEVAIAEARAIIDKFTGGQMPVELSMTLAPDENGCDSYSTKVEGGVLKINGSSGVALCRGFYSYIKSKGAGISTWSGSRFVPFTPTDEAEKVVKTPYRDHYYMNVVTFGYTTPYWDKERWDKEIDWMALHGIDMPLMLVAQEAVYRIVFKKMGMTDTEINKWETGPAHLPWMRMGNLAGNTFDGPLTKNWNEQQIELAKHLLNRMRKLGMNPITPAFGGFVPPAFSNYYSGQIDRTGWNWVPNDLKNYRLNPSSEAFVTVGRMFVETWDSIFGAGKYYLSDSFNEMAIPNNKDLLTQYGDSIYKSITSANPEATWVMQGWTLGYQRGDWDEGNFEALIKNVPDERFVMLDMATDYNNHYWNNGYNWDAYDSFYGKEWVWSVIPNMGGKTGMTGRLEYYANGRLDALNSPNRGKLIGYGFAPEGVENNEIVYELICDGGWENGSIDLNAWLENYSKNRYGKYTQELKDYHAGLRASVYGSFTDHPRYGWQTGNYNSSGSINQNNKFYEGIQALFSNTDELKANKLYKADLIEAAAFYVSGRVQNFCSKINAACDMGNTEAANLYLSQLDTLMTMLDASLSCHPLYRLELWEEQAKKMGATDEEKKKYARNARRIVSVWMGPHTRLGEPVNDYAARVWSGLVRDYYWPRMKTYFENRINGTSTSILDVENNFVNVAPYLSECTPVPEDTIGYLKEMIEFADDRANITFEKLAVIEPSNDYTNHWYAIRSGADNATTHVITQAGDNAVLKAQNYTVNGTQMWRFIKSGTEEGVYFIENRYGQRISATGAQSNAPIASTTNSNTNMKMVLAPDSSLRWFIYPNGQERISLHVNISANNNLTSWTTISDDGTQIHAGSTWTIEHVDAAVVPEVTNDDYQRYIAKLEALRGTPMEGELGQVKSEEALEAAIDTLKEWSSDINHDSYDTFLAKWARLYDSLFGFENMDTDARTLVEAIISARNTRNTYISDEVGHYSESVAKNLDAVIEEISNSLSDQTITAEQRAAQIKEIGDAVEAFLNSISNAEINMPKASTENVQHGYRMYTPNRGNLYLTSQGVGNVVMGVTDKTLEAGIWDFYLRADKTYNIRNRADLSYLSPASAHNTAIKTSESVPSSGWALKKAQGLYEVIITSGSVQLNQTNPGDHGGKIFNWGGGNNTSDTGCRYLVIYEGATTGIPQLEGIDDNASVSNGSITINGSSDIKVYSTDGRLVDNTNLSAGMCIAIDSKKRTYKVLVK